MKHESANSMESKSSEVDIHQKKEVYYLRHDANARCDVKIVKLRRVLGQEGYGNYWCVVEMLREAPGHKLPLSSIEDIAFDLHTDTKKLESLIRDFELFGVEGEYFYSARLCRDMDQYRQMKAQLSEAGKRGNAKRWGSPPDSPLIASQSQLNKKRINKKRRNENIESDINNSCIEEQKVKSFKKLTLAEFTHEVNCHVDTYPEEMLEDFIRYWSEPDERGKMKFQKQDTWNTKSRLTTWSNKSSKPKIFTNGTYQRTPSPGPAKPGTSVARTEALRNWGRTPTWNSAQQL